MIISQIVDLCCVQPSNVSCDKKTVKNIAFALDCIASITLLVLGILAITGTIALSPAAGWAFFGAGLTYASVMLLHVCHRTRVSCSE